MTNLKIGDSVWVYFSVDCRKNNTSQFAIANRHKETILSKPFKLYGSRDVINTTMHGKGKTLYALDVLELINY